ncbi:MAG TPA: hypothetical protein VIK07_08280 [Bacteroidales bacterium]
MLNKIEVQEALRRSQEPVKSLEFKNKKPINGQDIDISLLIHDIFGAEILKTHKKNGWHFYNRIDGERVDFSKSKKSKSIEDNYFDDLPAEPEETGNYLDKEDYSDFSMRFINAFEETVGLDKYQVGYSE